MFQYFCFLIFLTLTPHIALSVEILDNDDNLNTTVAPISEHTEAVEDENNSTEIATSGDGEIAPPGPKTTPKPLTRAEREYLWNHGTQESNIGKSLYGAMYRLVEGTHLVTQCAQECITDPQCKSYNFDKSAATCELNDETADDISKLIESENKVYIGREEFSAEPDAIGVCSKDLCKNDGYCMNTELADGTPSYTCICKKHWGGTHCTEPAGQRDWGDWEEWSECSVTCGNGYSHRKRNCMDSLSNKKVSPLDCFGRDMEFQICRKSECPRWESWSDWEECSTYTTCGRGFKTRTRTCSNGGTPGKDRLCMGPLNETTPCEEPSCEAPLKLVRGEGYGEGVIEIYNDKTKQWGNICYDGFEKTAGDIACKQIGLVGLSAVYKDDSPPSGDYLTLQHCEGDEVALQQCLHAGWKTNTDCQISAAIKCIVNGDWAAWSKWGNCSVTCAEGIRTRTRTCTHPPNLRGGKECEGEEMQTKPCTQPSCPVDGVWEVWETWSKCDISCGGGSQSRKRVCIGPFYNGAPCTGDSINERQCNTHYCPIDGVWEDWSMWSECSLSCNTGSQSRRRSCIGPYYLGENCDGPEVDTRHCNTHPCPIDGVWEEWSLWSECSLSCNTGSQSRHRSCIGPYYLGENCNGPEVDTRHCNTHPCPIDGVWSAWEDWEQCNVTCGGGHQRRTRKCVGRLYGGEDCIGERFQNQQCNSQHCPIDGIWEEWSDWSNCSIECGGGVQNRSRKCQGPYYGGALCDGPDSEEQSCNEHHCPVDGIWNSWDSWTECDASCGGGTKMRTRTCEGPYYLGKDCEGLSVGKWTCNDHLCPVDGKWGKFGEWSECSHSCGGGTQERVRDCFGPFYGGANCTGNHSEEQDCNPRPCPIDGTWLEWGEYSGCSASCAGGKKNRTRKCDGPYYDGEECIGTSSESETCNTRPCPVDGEYEEWSIWSDCDVTCAGGVQARSRECLGQAHGGLPCEGASYETQTCNTAFCPVDGVFENWSDWDTCSVTCGGGIQRRNRACIGPFYGGDDCVGARNESQECNTEPCPVDGVFMTWSDWALCSVTCGGGTHTRERTCRGPYYGGKNCSGPFEEQKNCNTHNCPIDGKESEWSDWSECSKSCGMGKQSRQRICIGPYYGGSPCIEHLNETRECQTQSCPVDGVFETWSNWTVCNVSCGGGGQARFRQCSGPFYGGSPCEGPFNETRDCNIHHCPVDGVFTAWSDWDPCSLECGEGVQWRYRTCQGPFYNGADCEGAYNESQLCNTHNCPVDGYLSEWEDWENCSLECGGGVQRRSRHCIGPFYDGKDCTEPLTESRMCNTHFCPVDGVLTEWADWMSCNVTCGGGVQWRHRTCIGPFYEGAPCPGALQESQLCNIQPCPVNGVWEPFNDWSECSVTCGGGSRFRTRECSGPFHGGRDCEGDSQETEPCNTESCMIPGEWLEWGAWGLCDQTCNAGKAMRKRECNMTTHSHLTDPCIGNDTMFQMCNNISCNPVPSCSHYYELGIRQNTTVDIDPDGPEGENEPFQVFCDMTTSDDGITYVMHDLMDRTQVQGYEGAGEYQHQLVYANGTVTDIGQITRLVDYSLECKQFIKWECKSAILEHQYVPEDRTTFWQNRYEIDMKYWGGGPPDGYGCACGLNHSCTDPTKTCNCDDNDEEHWRSDEGFITRKQDLPVTWFMAGDTGSTTPPEDAYVTLGPLICVGQGEPPTEPAPDTTADGYDYFDYFR